MADYVVDLYDEELECYTYDSFVEIWVYYYNFYRDREYYFEWAISLLDMSDAQALLLLSCMKIIK